MTKKQVAHAVAEAREKANRLRALKSRVGSIGRRGLNDTFDLGDALEEAAVLLRGSFSAWVKTECGIEPRTALGFRKTSRVLAEHKDWLIEQGVAPSVAVIIACAQPEGRERALAAIASERCLTAAGAKLIVRSDTDSRKDPRPQGLESFKAAARSFSDAFVDEVGRIASMAAKHDAGDETALVELAVRARALLPVVSALDARLVGGGRAEPHALAVAVANLAAAEDAQVLSAAASALARVAFGDAVADRDAVEASLRDTAPAAARSPAIRSTSSVFRHGLTTFEICAGGGGQAAGLAKAGFTHLGMLEREAKPCETLRAAFGPEHVIEADLVGYEPGEIGPIDLLAGGVPCTPFSQAGKRKGEHDESDCFPEALRLVKLMKPRAVMLENVTGLMGPANDLYRFSILSKLSRMGYQSEWRIVHCADFGVPQDRKRSILVAFKDPAAMARFKWPSPVADYAEEPYTMVSALDSVLRARGYEPPMDLLDRMDRTSPTIIGGSPKKASPDLGQPKSRKVWDEIGYVTSRWGEYAPGHDHVGPITPTNTMIARLQGFPSAWPFKGSKRDVYRQIANAFPPVVAMHLGCAIATALTGTEYLPQAQRRYEFMGTVITPHSLMVKRGPAIARAPVERAPLENRKEIPLALLRESSSIHDPEQSEGDLHDIDYSELRDKFGPWPADMWKHQRLYGRP